MLKQATWTNLLLLFALSTTNALAQSGQKYTETPEVMRIVEKFNDRLRHYHGFEFEYEVSFFAEGTVEGEYETNSGQSINRVRFADPIDEGSLQPRVFWEKTIENPGEPLHQGDRITSQWIAFDGRQTRKFDQAMFTAPKSDIDNFGLIRPGPSLGLIRESEDCFLAFISNDIYHSMTYMRNFDPNDLLGRFRVSFDGTRDQAGQECRVVNFEPLPDLGYGSPHASLLAVDDVPMVLRSENGTYGTVSDWGSFEEVTKVGEFDGIRYPAEGKCVTSLGNSILKGQFKVLNVRRLSQSEIENWFPEWPPGTSVVDKGTGTVTRIPYTAEQQDIIRRFMLKRNTLSAIGWGSVTMMTFNLIAVSIIGYFVYRKVRTAFS